MNDVTPAGLPAIRVLVVEDDPTDLKLASTVLRDAGNEVIVARDAEMALAILGDRKVEVVLIDLELPGMNGLELMRRLKLLPLTAGVPVMAMTAYPGRFSPAAASEVGLAAYLVKPIDTRTLAQQVAAVAAQGSRRAPHPAILVADDNATNRRLLRAVLVAEGYSVIEARDGSEALAILLASTGPVVGLIDWEMPLMEGIDVCRQARLRTDPPPMFLILLTVRDTQRDIVAGLQAGANDYVTKPFERAELLARVKIGMQMVELQQSLATRVLELQAALADVKQLSGFLPICSYCKKIRDDGDYWHQVEAYVAQHSAAKFSHSICPECYSTRVQPELDRLSGKSSSPASGPSEP
jgi:sigma-B regulation protein RsbU (phosphoserine phosphatase)